LGKPAPPVDHLSLWRFVMARHGKVGVPYKPGKQSFLVLKADGTTPFKTVSSVNVLATSAITGVETSFWTPTILNQSVSRIAIKLSPLPITATKLRKVEDGTDTPTGDISV